MTEIINTNPYKIQREVSKEELTDQEKSRLRMLRKSEKIEDNKNEN